MRLSIDKAWRDRLLQVRSCQAIAPEVEMLLSREAVFLYGWLGHSAYLGLDGRVVAWASAEGLGPQVVEDVMNVARLIAIGARWLALPELVQIIPPVPPGEQVCPMCEGRRWDDTPRAGHPEGSVCFICKGLGWRTPVPAAAGNSSE